jgi:exodeoxyribonuclease V gamma subunit
MMAPIVVPNLSIETYLKYEIAKSAGIAAGLKFHVIESFLAELLPPRDKNGRELKLLNHTALRAFFVSALSDVPCSPPQPEAVQAYLTGADQADDGLDLRRFQLASRLAGLVQRYSNNRPELLHTWAQGHSVFGDSPIASTEQWQRDIWARWNSLDALPTSDAKGRYIRWIQPLELLGPMDDINFVRPDEVHFFGFSYMGQGLRDLVERLSTTSDINIYIFSPFENAQDEGQSTATEPRAVSVNRKMAELSLVAHWGSPGREYLQMLRGLPGVEVRDIFAGSDRKTVLGRLQREILRNASEGGSGFHHDDSLVICGCASVRREVEFVANEIWKLIRDDERAHSTPDCLRFCDIAVLLGDSSNWPVYQAHFRAVFEDLHGIPFNMVDVPVASECRVVEAMLLLLNLPMGEFTRPELLTFLNHPAVRVRFPESDAVQWRSWCAEVGIVHGADRSDHEGTYINRDLFNWEQGLRRLVLGAFMTGPGACGGQVFRLGNSEYLPYEQPTDALASAGRMLVLVRSLLADARFARSTHLTMTDWSKFLVGMVHRYLGADADNDSEQRALSGCLQKIQGLRGLEVNGQKVGYRIACESLRSSLEDWTETRGHYLVNGVVVSPLLEMRSLPFRVVFLCGLGEGRFPVAGGLDPLDLTLVDRKVGDVRPRERDKYLFLETLVCARDRLYLSYVDRDAQTGDPLEPSPVVHELVRHLHGKRSGPPSGMWITKQPLRRFDEAFFPDHAKGNASSTALPNFSVAAKAEWRARKLRQALRKQCGAIPRLSWNALRRLNPKVVNFLGLCPIESTVSHLARARRLSVSIRDLRYFLECPLQGWARVMLRLREDEERAEATREDEPFQTGRRSEVVLLREVFLSALGRNTQGVDPASFAELYDQHNELRVRQGRMPIGVFGAVERRRHLDLLCNWHEAARVEKLLDASPFAVHRFGRAAETEHVDQLQPPLMLDVPLVEGAQPTPIEIFGHTEIVSEKLPGSLTPILRPSATEKDHLRGFFDAVILSLLPERHNPTADYTHAILLPDKARNEVPIRVFRGIQPVQARGFLIDLLRDLFGGSHAYLLPCEAVFDYLFKEARTPIAVSVEKMKESDRQQCSSRYGPVPDFEQYDPPHEQQARVIIERRFGLFRDAGEVSR